MRRRDVVAPRSSIGAKGRGLWHHPAALDRSCDNNIHNIIVIVIIIIIK